MFPMRFKISDRSMEPDFKQGDYVIVNRLSYIFKSPSNGDVVVFKHPKEKNKFLIKRILKTTNAGKYFAVGDNQKYSKDSRQFGPVKRNLIVGKVLFHFKS